MIVSVESQAYIFLCSIIAGMIVGLLYDFFRILRKTIKTGAFLTYLQDVLFWLMVAAVIFTTVYYSNEGELRSYIFFGAFLGLIFYALLLSRIVMKSSLFILRIIGAVVKFFWTVLSFPLRITIALLKLPIKIIGRFFFKASLTRKIFKNKRKNI